MADTENRPEWDCGDLSLNERRSKMPRLKILAFITLITLAFAIAMMGEALAGEKVKGRNVYYTTQWQQIAVGDEEGHIIAISEAKSVTTILLGKAIPDGLAGRAVGLWDMGKTGIRSIHVYEEFTDKDGDKIYCEDKGEGKWSYVKGTGKFEGIKGGRNRYGPSLDPTASFCGLGSRGGAAAAIVLCLDKLKLPVIHHRMTWGRVSNGPAFPFD
jgi:hypothetical protein